MVTGHCSRGAGAKGNIGGHGLKLFALWSSKMRYSDMLPALVELQGFGWQTSNSNTIISHVIIVFELHCIVSDCSVQCANMTIARYPETTVSIMCMHIIKYKSIDICMYMCLCMSCSHYN